MFVIDNQTPYAADRTCVMGRHGELIWVVVVRATYDIAADGTTKLAEEQAPPTVVAEYHGVDGRSSIRYETDLVPPKPATDVLVNGFAYAPEGRPMNEFPVSLQLGPLCKELIVRGDRRWKKGLTGSTRPGSVTPVARVPLLYERAHGGYDDLDTNPKRQRIDLRNPVGCGVAAKPQHLEGLPVANFEYPGKDSRRTGPAGFGPIACHWKPRLDHAGTYDEAWSRSRKPHLPEDFDEHYYQCAPADQQLATGLSRGARLSVTNLSPAGALSVQLPRVHLRYTTHFTSAARQPFLDHRGKLNTILLEPEYNRLTLVWSTMLDCGRDIDHIEDTRVVEKEHMTWGMA